MLYSYYFICFYFLRKPTALQYRKSSHFTGIIWLYRRWTGTSKRFTTSREITQPVCGVIQNVCFADLHNDNDHIFPLLPGASQYFSKTEILVNYLLDTENLKECTFVSIFWIFQRRKVTHFWSLQIIALVLWVFCQWELWPAHTHIGESVSFPRVRQGSLN